MPSRAVPIEMHVVFIALLVPKASAPIDPHLDGTLGDGRLCLSRPRLHRLLSSAQLTPLQLIHCSQSSLYSLRRLPTRHHTIENITRPTESLCLSPSSSSDFNRSGASSLNPSAIPCRRRPPAIPTRRRVLSPACYNHLRPSSHRPHLQT